MLVFRRLRFFLCRFKPVFLRPDLPLFHREGARQETPAPGARKTQVLFRREGDPGRGTPLKP